MIRNTGLFTKLQCAIASCITLCFGLCTRYLTNHLFLTLIPAAWARALMKQLPNWPDSLWVSAGIFVAAALLWNAMFRNFLPRWIMRSWKNLQGGGSRMSRFWNWSKWSLAALELLNRERERESKRIADRQSRFPVVCQYLLAWAWQIR